MQDQSASEGDHDASTLLRLLIQTGSSGRNRGFRILHDAVSLHALFEGKELHQSDESELVRSTLVHFRVRGGENDVLADFTKLVFFMTNMLCGG